MNISGTVKSASGQMISIYPSFGGPAIDIHIPSGIATTTLDGVTVGTHNLQPGHSVTIVHNPASTPAPRVTATH